MLLIPHFVARSPLHGYGCFTAVPIQRGAALWEFNPEVDRRFTPAERDQSPPAVQKELDHFGYMDGGLIVMCGDGARWFNHSDTPNCAESADRQRTLAARDIAAGEELTSNYRDFDEGGHACAAFLEAGQ